MSKRNPVSVACAIIAVLCFCAALIIAPLTTTAETSTTINTSIMSAEGIFDRVELVDRHYGNWNGQEVEGEVLAVLYENGSVGISTEHYEAFWNGFTRETYYIDGETYPLFLYVYDGPDHLRERISVEAGTSEEFIYLNMTVTVYLGRTIDITPYTDHIGHLYATILVVAGISFALVAFWKIMEPQIGE